MHLNKIITRTFKAFNNLLIKYTALQNGFQCYVRLTDGIKELGDITALH